jgi:hypothetical protein
MNELNPFFQYQAHSRAFLARARENLACFERDGQAQHFFYAALELRFGIEARLNEYLAPALKTIGKTSKEVPEYVATRLLTKLVTIDPTSEQPATLRFTPELTGDSSVAHYTPVSRRLAAIHGQLGELLHYKFFVKNEHWLLRKPLGGNPHRSILDFVELLNEGVAELELATSGTLLGNPKFTALVEEVLSEGACN